MYKLSLFIAVGLLFIACGKKDQSGDDFSKPSTDSAASSEPASYDPNRGEGKYDKVDLAPTLDLVIAAEGEKIADVKCTSCHKSTDEKLVGPGWKGVTSRFQPQWIMNFITNPDPMITKDPKMQAQLEICLVRMPNQGLSDTEARNVLEYMRQIDGVK